VIGAGHGLTAGYIARHVPPGSGLGADVALLDVSQDFLLAHLHERGVFEHVTFKGGTALRKLFAGSQGRFSTDLDFAAADIREDRSVVAQLIADECQVVLGPFTYRADRYRGRWQIAVASGLGSPSLTIKLDVGPPCWTTAEPRTFVPTPIHARYGFALPVIPCMRLEEMMAEKIARLTRRSTARDAWDLTWIARTTPHSQFDRALVRRLAMLKVWVDNCGAAPGYSPAIDCRPFDPDKWLRKRDQWDDEQIGLLSGPPPRLADLEAILHTHYSWLRDGDADEAQWGQANPRDRAVVINAITELPFAALSAQQLY
jgi:uncharacterized protein